MKQAPCPRQGLVLSKPALNSLSLRLGLQCGQCHHAWPVGQGRQQSQCCPSPPQHTDVCQLHTPSALCSGAMKNAAENQRVMFRVSNYVVYVCITSCPWVGHAVSIIATQNVIVSLATGYLLKMCWPRAHPNLLIQSLQLVRSQVGTHIKIFKKRKTAFHYWTFLCVLSALSSIEYLPIPGCLGVHISWNLLHVHWKELTKWEILIFGPRSIVTSGELSWWSSSWSKQEYFFFEIWV